MKSFVVFGFSAHDGRSKTLRRMMDFGARLGETSDVDVAVTPVPSYERLAQLVQRGDIDLAWLSPISLVSLARNRLVRPILSLRREGAIHYRSALIVNASSRVSSVADLRGARAAWVDRHSASGFVLPRIELAAHGLRNRDLGSERLYGSHEAAVRAVAAGQADFGATFVRVDVSGASKGSWSSSPGLEKSVRVLSVFGDIPPDALATRHGVDAELRDQLSRGLRTMMESRDERQLVTELFGALGFDVPSRRTYEPLRDAVFAAYRAGLLEIDAAAAQVTSDAGATVERRAPRDVPSRRKLTSEMRQKDDVEEADVIEIVDAMA